MKLNTTMVHTTLLEPSTESLARVVQAEARQGEDTNLQEGSYTFVVDRRYQTWCFKLDYSTSLKSINFGVNFPSAYIGHNHRQI